MIRLTVLICLCFSIFPGVLSQTMQKENYTYLALGDSYTIGEGVSLHNNFPSQTVDLLVKAAYSTTQATIVAKTGWTTKELQAGIAGQSLDTTYDIVSLLIGVNDQYRGEDPQQYKQHFEELIQRSIAFASNMPARVFVLSIPDWGVTPYAEGRDRKKIAREIDSYNFINKQISEKWRVNYLDITRSSREAAEDHSLITGDGLHPSAKEYHRWATILANAIQQQL